MLGVVGVGQPFAVVGVAEKEVGRNQRHERHKQVVVICRASLEMLLSPFMMRWTVNQPKQQAASSRPSGRVNAAAAKLSDATSRPQRLFPYTLRQTTAAMMKKVNCRVSNPPLEVQAAKVALLHSRPSAIQPTSPRFCSEGRRTTHHIMAAMVADGVGDREPGGDVFRAQAEDTPDGGQFQDPEEVGVALDVFAGVEDQAVITFEQIARVAKADESVVAQEPGDAGEPARGARARGERRGWMPETG